MCRMVALQDERVTGNPARFATTRWSLVLTAGQRHSQDCDAALETLCRTYWYPIYAYVRRRGYSSEDASDLTQGFFARLLEQPFLAGADKAKGRFRSYLLASLQHFLANEWDAARTQRRGGGRPPISIDAAAASGLYQLEPAHDQTAETVFERRWALALLDQVLRRLRAEYVDSGKERLFEVLKPALVEPERTLRYRDIGNELGMTEGAVKVAVYRMRRRYRDHLLSEVENTVASPEEVGEELHSLFTAVGG